MPSYPCIRDLDLKERRVFVRVDFNVPLEETADGFRVTDDTRIRGSLPTIFYVIQKGGKVILASHLGRPDGKVDAKFSLEPVALRLSDLLGRDVLLTEDCVGDAPQGLSKQMKGGEVLMLENLRFHPGEESNSIEFVNDLAALCDIYINDAFGALHRAHASTVGLPEIAAEKAIGFLVEKELEYLTPLRDNPQRPFGIMMGGAKISDKMGVMEHYLPKVDKIFIGGAMAYAFLKAKGCNVGKSLCDYKQVTLATKILKGAEARNVKLFLPIDHVVTRKIDDFHTEITKDAEISENFMGVDIGPQTLALFEKECAGLETIFWNGPLGVYEVPEFAKGTLGVAEMLSRSPAEKFAGGGDVVAAISQAGCAKNFDFISTGGGATLEFLEGIRLPGLKALEVHS